MEVFFLYDKMYYLRNSVKFLKINVLLFHKSVWFAYLNGNFIQNPHTKQHVTTAEGGSCFRKTRAQRSIALYRQESWNGLNSNKKKLGIYNPPF